MVIIIIVIIEKVLIRCIMKMWTINELLILKKVNTIDTHTKEQQFSNLVRSYRKEYVGKGPNSIRVSFKDNWAIAHMTGVLSKVESFYLNDKRNESMLHYTRTEKIKQMYKEIDVN